MGLFDRKSKQKQETYTPTYYEIEIPEPWDYAKRISLSEAQDPDLPCGWYIFEDGGCWYGYKPDPETGGMLESGEAYSPYELEEWLGVPVAPPEPPKKKAGLDATIGRASEQIPPENRPVWGTPVTGYNKPSSQDEPPDYLKRMGLAEENPTDEPPTDVENRWAEKQLTEKLKEAEAEIQDAQALLASNRTSTSVTNEDKPKKKRKSLGRTNRVQIRLTDSELTQFQSRVKKSGLSQGDFLRSAALHGQIIVEEHDVVDVMLLDELAMIRAELGRQGGLLKMITKPNRGQRELAPEEWEDLMDAIRGLDSMKEKISNVEAMVNGNHKASNQ